jgi:hypothetical protein
MIFPELDAVGFSDSVLAAMIGAAATIGTALFQLVHNWRAQAAGDRKTKRGGFRSLMMLLLIMAACVVAGYALSEYRSQSLRDETHALRQELQQQVKILEASTARLELVNRSADDQNRATDLRRQGIDGVEALVQVPACKGVQMAFTAERSACSESEATHVAVCAIVPAKAQVSEVLLFSRAENSTQPWSESRVTMGQEAGSARFVDPPVERVHTESTKQVCSTYVHWASDKGHMARIVVKYAL